jgi:hypothetical protein
LPIVVSLATSEVHGISDAVIKGLIGCWRGDSNVISDLAVELRISKDVAEALLTISTGGLVAVDNNESVKRLESRLELDPGVFRKLSALTDRYVYLISLLFFFCVHIAFFVQQLHRIPKVPCCQFDRKRL